MKVILTNKASYSREIQFFREYRFKVLNPRESLTIENVTDPIAIAYYESHIPQGFGVELMREDKSSADESSVPGTALDNNVEIDLSKYSDDELKRIVKNLGISSNYRARWRLESVVTENLPEGQSPEEYL